MAINSSGLIKIGAVLLLSLVHGGYRVGAQDQQTEVESVLTAYEVRTNEAGAEYLGPASEILPGGVIEYHLDYVNHTDGPLGGFIIEGRIPHASSYIINSQSADLTAEFEARTGDIDWPAPPLVRYVEDADGVMRPENVPASEYEAIRWRLSAPVEPEIPVRTVYRVRVDR